MSKEFPVLDYLAHENCPPKIKWSSLDEAHAMAIHGQTLKRLAERGGLSVKEIVLNVEKSPMSDIYTMDNQCALIVVRRLEVTND